MLKMAKMDFLTTSAYKLALLQLYFTHAKPVTRCCLTREKLELRRSYKFELHKLVHLVIQTFRTSFANELAKVGLRLELM
jgi:hypothetical protein